MPEPLRVEPHLLAASGRGTVDDGHAAYQELSGHDAALAEAGAGWVGSSAAALSELGERWQIRHGAHLEHTQSLGERMSHAGHAYAAADGDTGSLVTRAADAIAPDRMGL